ncbi:hypothetical protein T492DRAFT_1147018 [Pavlovales sp. CCMP2436]|nr:hypothetical protein T492DRAFT_1147018 [Pavlovales sp. CCMP2436]
MDHQADLSSLLGEMELSGGGMGRQHMGLPTGFQQMQQQMQQQDPRYAQAGGMGAPQRGNMMRQGLPPGAKGTMSVGQAGMGMHPGHMQQGQRQMLGEGIMGQQRMQGGNRMHGGMGYDSDVGQGQLGLGGGLSQAQIEHLLSNPTLLAQNPTLMQLVASGGGYGAPGQGPLGAHAQGTAGMFDGIQRGGQMMGGPGAPMGYDGSGFYGAPGPQRADAGMLGMGLGMQGGAGQLPPSAAQLLAEGGIASAMPAAPLRPRASERAIGIRETGTEFILEEAGWNRKTGERWVHPATTFEEICNEVGIYGPIESITIDQEKGFAQVCFVDPASAAQLCVERSLLQFRGQLSAVALEKSRPMPAEVAQAVMAGATRNLYLNLDFLDFWIFIRVTGILLGGLGRFCTELL